MIKPLDKSNVLYKQIAAFFETEILAGRLKEGDRIASTTELAEQFQVNAETIQQSLSMLSKRGLVKRRPKLGTFVNCSFPEKSIAIVCGRDMFARSDMEFHKVYFSLLLDYFESHGWDCKVFLTTSENVFDSTYYKLKHAVESGAVRAVIEFGFNDCIGNYVRNEVNLPRPSGQEWIDYENFLFTGFRYLYRYGARRVALVGGDALIENLESALKKFNTPKMHSDFSVEFFYANALPQKGYSVLNTILQVKKPFDSIFSGNDTVTQGILYGILEKGLRFPKDFRFLTYSNKGIDIFSQFRLSRLEFDPMDLIRYRYEEIMCQFEGRKPKLAQVCSHLVPGETCGE